VFQDPLNFFQLPFINAVARELSRSYVATAAAAGADDAPLAPDGFVWAPRMAVFPHPSLQSTSLLAQVLSSFVFAALMFGFVTQVGGWCRGEAWRAPAAPRCNAAACVCLARPTALLCARPLPLHACLPPRPADVGAGGRARRRAAPGAGQHGHAPGGVLDQLDVL
jgi:hypothetical protein